MANFELLDRFLREGDEVYDDPMDTDNFDNGGYGDKFGFDGDDNLVDEDIMEESDRVIAMAMKDSLKNMIYFNESFSSSDKVGALRKVDTYDVNSNQVSEFLENKIDPILLLSGFFGLQESRRDTVIMTLPLYHTALLMHLNEIAEGDNDSEVEDALEDIKDTYDLSDSELKDHIDEAANYLRKYGINACMADLNEIAELVETSSLYDGMDVCQRVIEAETFDYSDIYSILWETEDKKPGILSRIGSTIKDKKDAAKNYFGADAKADREAKRRGDKAFKDSHKAAIKKQKEEQKAAKAKLKADQKASREQRYNASPEGKAANALKAQRTDAANKEKAAGGIKGKVFGAGTQHGLMKRNDAGKMRATGKGVAAGVGGAAVLAGAAYGAKKLYDKYKKKKEAVKEAVFMIEAHLPYFVGTEYEGALRSIARRYEAKLYR